MRSQLHTQMRAICLTSLLTFFFSLKAFASNTYYVDASASSGSNTGTSWSNAWLDFQSALTAAVSGDIVYVAQGIYKPSVGIQASPTPRTNTFTLSSGVIYYGGFPPGGGTLADRDFSLYRTILSGDIGTPNVHTDNCFIVVNASGLGSSTQLNGFTVEYGRPDSSTGFTMYGQGAIHLGTAGSMQLQNVTVRNNSGYSAAGVYTVSPVNWVVSGCTFSDNTGAAAITIQGTASGSFSNSSFSNNTSNANGSVFNMNTNSSAFTVSNCSFTNNHGNLGAILCNGSGTSFTDCSFTGNTASSGGVIYSFYGGDSFTRCTFSQNSATNDGGCFVVPGFTAGITLDRCVFTANSATTNVGGVLNNGNRNSSITNCVFWNNSAPAYTGGAIYNNGGVMTITNCSFNKNACGSSVGGALENNSGSSIISNSIFWGNTAGGNDAIVGSEIGVFGSGVTVTNTIWQGNTTGGTIYNTNPLFTNTTTGDLTLQDCSPAIDAGATNSLVTDVAGNTRPIDNFPGGLTYDLGAYEKQTFPLLPEINVVGNSTGIVDGDITPDPADHTDFGNVTIGTSITRTYTIENSGSAALTLSSMTKTGTNQSEFAISGITTPASLAGSNSTTTFTVTFTPTGTGARTATIHIASDDCDEADYDFAVQGIGVCTVNTWTGATSFNWGTASNWSCGQVPDATTDVVIPNVPTQPFVVSSTNSVRNLTINSGARLEFSGTGSRLDIYGTVTVNGTFDVQPGSVAFRSTSPQVIPGTYYTNIIVDGSGLKTMGGNVTVENLLTLNSGNVQLDASNLTITGVGSVSGGSVSSHIITNGAGRLIQQGVGGVGRTGVFILPVGTSASSYTPATISNAGTADNFTAGVIDNVYSSYAGDVPSGSPMTTNAVAKTWLISEGTPGGSSAAVILQWNSADGLSGFSKNSCLVGHYTSGAWTGHGSTLVSAGGADPYTRQSATITSFSPFSVFGFDPCISPSVPTVSATTNPICNGSSTMLSIATGSLNSATNWQWYSGSCGGASVGSGTSITVAPGTTTTYYARGEGGCLATPGSCGTTTVTVNLATVPGALSATPSSICFGGASNLNATSSGNTISWYTVPAGGTSIGSAASGFNFSVSPSGTTTYYAEAVTPDNTMLGNMVANGNGNGSQAYTMGYEFTPNANITVTGVRSYYGSKVSVWNTSNTSAPVISQAVAGSPGAWTVTALSSPITLTAGTAYRVGVYTTGSYYNGNTLPTTFANGTIGNAYYTGVDGYPGALDNPSRISRMVDLQFSGSGCISTSRTPVTVTVNQLPTASLSGSTTICSGGSAGLAFSGSPNAIVTYSDGTNSNSVTLNGAGTATVSVSPSTTTTYTATNVVSAAPANCTGSVSGNATVTVNTRPVFTICPASPITANTASNSCNAVITYPVTITASGTPTPTYSYSLNGSTPQAGTGDGNSFSKGTTTVVVNATNSCGTTTTPCTFNVVVSDVTAPAVTCAAPVTINMTTGQCTGTTTLTRPTATDNCNTLGNGLDFNGTPSYATLPSGVYFNGNMTVEAWVFPRNSFTNWTRIIDFGNGAGSNNVLLAYTSGTSGLPAFYINGTQVVSNTAIPLNQWSHIAATLNGTTGTIYINGAAAGTATLQVPANVTRTLNYVGRSNWGTGIDPDATAVFDELRIWNVARTQTEIQTAMGRELAGTETGLQVYYNFNQGIACGNNTGITTVPNLGALGSAGNATLQSMTLNGGCADNFTTGAIAPVTLTSNAPATYTKGTTAVTWTARDAAGNTNTCTQSVTVVDNQPPVVTCPTSGLSVNVVANTCAGNYTIADPISDNCTGATWGYSFSGATSTASPVTGIPDGSASGSLSFNKGATVVTLSGTDGTNNAATCQFTVTVTDNQAPVLTCPTAGLSLNVAPGTCAANYTILDPISDNCTGATWSATFSGNSNGNPTATGNIADGSGSGAISFNKGTTTVTLNGTDGTNSATSCSFNVVVTDNEAPVITCASNQTVNAATGQCGAAVTYNVTATDNCGGVGGSSSLASVLSAINSNQSSLLSNVPNPYPFAMDGPSGVNGNYISDGGNDMYDGGNMLNTNLQTNIFYSDNSIVSSSAFGTGGQYFTRYISNGGNGRMFIMAADVNGLSSFGITGNIGADNFGSVDGASLNITANGIGYNVFVKRIYNAGDPSVNQVIIIPTNASASQTFASNTDNGLHTVSGLSGTTRIYYLLYASASGGYVNNTTTTSIVQNFLNTTVAGGALTLTQTAGLPSGSTFPVGTTTNTFVATDASNNTSSPCSFTVTVLDNQAPVVTCPTSGLNINVTPNSCTGSYTIADPIADNCTSAQWGYSTTGATTLTSTGNSIADGTSSGALSFNKGATVVTLTGTDGTNTATSCQFTVNVSDNQAPVVACPSNVSLSVAPNTCAASYTIVDPVSDNCTGATWGASFTGNALGNPSNVSGIADGSNSNAISFNRGTTTVSLSGTDGTNTATGCQFTVTVTDNQNPTIKAPADVVVNGWCTNVPAADVTLGTPTGVSDNCGTTNVSNNAPTSYPVGTTTVVWTVNDGNGNSATANQTVTVNPAVINPNAAVFPLYPMSGQEIQTMYLGYSASAQSETITVNPSGGTSPYAYSWTKSACNNSSSVSNLTNSSNSYSHPAVSSDICNTSADNVYTYVITITDDHGCTTTATKRINVVNPFAQNGTDVVLCHKVAVRGGSTTQLMTVTPSQTALHLAHGDYLGNCPVFIGKEGASVPEEAMEEQHVAVYPNPTTGVFILEISEIREEATILVTDVAGKLVSMKTLGKNDTPTATFDLSALARGMYLIQVRDGALNYRTKIVVQ